MRFWRDVGEAMMDGFRVQRWQDWSTHWPRLMAPNRWIYDSWAAR